MALSNSPWRGRKITYLERRQIEKEHYLPYAVHDKKEMKRRHLKKRYRRA
jgi:hypothetical protein